MNTNRQYRTLFAVVVFIQMSLCVLAQDSPPAEGAQFTEPTGSITLQTAIDAALLGNPDLATYSWDIRAADARIVQARLRPNPELDVEIEDVRLGEGPGTRSRQNTISLSPGGVSLEAGREDESGARSGFAEAQFTLSLSQLVELGGKRAKRVQLASRDRDVATWDYEVARADVLKEVAQAFVEVLVAQERVALDDELVRLAEQVHTTVSARVDAGRVSPLEATKAETALSMSRVQANLTKRELDSARARLAGLWGGKEARFGQAEGSLDDVRDVPSLDELVTRASRSPDLARWSAELEKRRSAISVEKANATPDLTISAGFRSRGVPDRDVQGVGFGTDGLAYSSGHSRSDGNWESSAVLGFSMPLPLFNRNQGSIKEAEHLAAKAGAEKRATDVELHATLTESYQSLSAALAAIASLKEDIVPAATQTFDSINEAYRQGKVGYLDVLDAQRTLFEARQQYLDALEAYHQSIAEIERLTGDGLWSANAAKPRPAKEN